MRWVILLAVLVLCSRAEDDGDWVDPFVLPIGFAVRGFYAGYLNVSANKALYYVYTPSEGNPSKDPLVVMVSPGPGCSSLHSWLYSKGEFTFTRNTTNFRHNPHSWNKQANVLYIEGPAGVGYTIGVETEVNDNVTQNEYYRALLRFYEKFPELKDQKMYLTGYGYAGIIIPKLALNIYEHNANPDTPAWLRVNINGMLLFNPCTMGDECDGNEYNAYTVNALRNSFFISKTLYEDYKTHCTLRLSECTRVEQKIESDFRITGADLRNLYTECLHQTGDYGCIDHMGIDIFLNVKSVKEDLNADITKKWDLCNNSLTKAYKRDPDGSVKAYETLIREEFGRPPLRVVVLVSHSGSSRVPNQPWCLLWAPRSGSTRSSSISDCPTPVSGNHGSSTASTQERPRRCLDYPSSPSAVQGTFFATQFLHVLGRA